MSEIGKYYVTAGMKMNSTTGQQHTNMVFILWPHAACSTLNLTSHRKFLHLRVDGALKDVNKDTEHLYPLA